MLLEHPFYRRWEAGELSRDELTQYAQQYRHFEAMLPTFLTSLVNRLDQGGVRDLLRANLRDEVGPPSHLALFDDFASHYDAAPTSASPAMGALLDAYDTVLAQSNVAAVAGLLAYEVQGADIARTKGDGLRDHYNATPSAQEFWNVHAAAEVDHAQWTIDALELLRVTTPETDDVVEFAATSVAAAWWSFLDERELLAA